MVAELRDRERAQFHVQRSGLRIRGLLTGRRYDPGAQGDAVVVDGGDGQDDDAVGQFEFGVTLAGQRVQQFVREDRGLAVAEVGQLEGAPSPSVRSAMTCQMPDSPANSSG